MQPRKQMIGKRIAITSLCLVLSLTLQNFLRPVKVQFHPSPTMPLGGYMEIRTFFPSQVRMTLKGRDDNDISLPISEIGRGHQIPVLGLYPDYKNILEITILQGNGIVSNQEFGITTPSLPVTFPEVEVIRHHPEKIQSGLLFCHLGHYDEEGNYSPLPCGIDPYGRVRWFLKDDIGHVLKRLDNGHFMVQRENKLVEMDMFGNLTGHEVTIPRGLHHDAIVLPQGNFLALTSGEDSFEDAVVEISRNSGGVVQEWDFRSILDPLRPPQPRNLEEQDWLHLNGICYDQEDDAFVVSGRDQSALVKLGKKTGKLHWVLSNPEHWKPRFHSYLLSPKGNNFEWPWGQHAPAVHPEDNTRLLVYDNGNFRSYSEPLLPEKNYSRAVEYKIDEKTMTVRQIWQFGKELGSAAFTPFIGDANYLPNGNRLVCFGGITRDLDGNPMEIFDFEEMSINQMKISARIYEVTSETPATPIIEWHFENKDQDSYKGYRVYRAVKLPLYPEAYLSTTVVP